MTADLLRGRKLEDITGAIGGAALLLNEFNLDLCNSHDVALEDAAQQAGVDLAVLENALRNLDDRASAGPPPQETDELIGYIISRYHDTHRRELPALVKLARKVEALHSDHPQAPHGLANTLQRLLGEIEVHMKKEELILFPAMRRHPGGALAAPIAQMRHDHDDHSEHLRDLETTTGNFTVPRGACGSWQALYRGLDKFRHDLLEHVRIENDVLFPRFEPVPQDQHSPESVETYGSSASTTAAQAREDGSETALLAGAAKKENDNDHSAVGNPGTGNQASGPPYSGASLLPMLVGGLVLIVLAMVAALALS